MNAETTIAVHCYAGDAQQVEQLMPKYLHHERPTLVLSPSDAPVTFPWLGDVMARSAGSAAYTGRITVDRQQRHLEILAEMPGEWFLLNDSDSFCLSPELPGYLYENPETVWANASTAIGFIGRNARDAVEIVQTAERFAWVAQPPLFLSREALERMLQVSDVAKDDLPIWANLIDWYFVAMADRAELTLKPFPDGMSRPIWSVSETARAYYRVRTEGLTMIHSVKELEVMETLALGFHEFHNGPEPFPV